MKDSKTSRTDEAMLRPRDAAVQLRISYPTVKQWIYHRKLRAVKTPGGITAFLNQKSIACFTVLVATMRTSDGSATSASADATNSSDALWTFASADW